jgi:hypothetical protein
MCIIQPQADSLHTSDVVKKELNKRNSKKKKKSNYFIALKRAIWNCKKKGHVGHVWKAHDRTPKCLLCSVAPVDLLSSTLPCLVSMSLTISRNYIEGFNIKEIGRVLGVKKSIIYQTLNYHRNYGVIYNLAAFSVLPNG